MEDLEMLEKEQKQEIIQAIRENRLYDHICNNYWRIEDMTLIDLLLECIATIEEGQNKKLIENLKEYKDWKVR